VTCRGRLVVAGVVLVGLFTLPTFMMRAVLPYVTGSAGVHGEWMSRILYAGFIMLAVASPLAGWVCDRLGAWRVALVSAVLLAPLTLIYLLVHGFWGLLVVRLANSCIGEMLIAAANTIAAHATVSAGLGFGVLRFIEGVGIAVGPYLGGFLAEISLPLAVSAAAALMTPIALGALVAGRCSGGGGDGRRGLLESLRGSAMVLSAPRLLVLLVAACGQVAGFAILLSYYTTLLVEELHLGPSMYGVFLAAESIGYSLGSLFSEKLYPRLGVPVVAMSSLVLAAVYFTLSCSRNVAVVLALAPVLGLSAGEAFNPVYMEAARRAGEWGRGVVVNTVDMIVNISMAAVSLLLDPLVPLIGLRGAVVVAALINLGAGLLAILYLVRAYLPP